MSDCQLSVDEKNLLLAYCSFSLRLGSCTTEINLVQRYWVFKCPTMRQKITGNFLIQWPSDDHFLWCCTIPAISKEWRHKLHPKKVCSVLEKPDINGSLTCKEKKKQWLWSSKLLITWNIVNDRMYVTWDFRYQLL